MNVPNITNNNRNTHGVYGRNTCRCGSARALTTPIYTIIAGLGGRPITKESLHRAFGEAVADEIDDPHFLDLDWAVIDRELARAKEKRRSGPIAENILREMGLVGGKPV